MKLEIELQEYRFNEETKRKMKLEPILTGKVLLTLIDGDTNRSSSIELHVDELQKALRKIEL